MRSIVTLLLTQAILSVADLEKITVKKIRHALQELFSVDLQPNKKAINDVILNRYYDLVSRRSQENDSEEDRKAEIIKQDEIMAQKLQGEMSSRTPGRRKAAPKRKNSTTNNSGATKPPSKTGFNREMALSSQLQEVIGEEKCSRPRVVKLLWAYIKDRDLQNPQDKRQINCDEKLTALFKKSKLS
ncbi:hypothetical protein PGUG_05740 [Meyerozyma guilliermondii ATCC 6260]|uniref:Uncharacterized protein n=1 Tax=Meyerozyma guilliermondii (strain ATCC 6260 / CBS 566 / DSM 6381 / JCM 1539 / NBRC 10279 / NRRL Y-324) TaxID=294746 RepID=A5DR39_PICGU|nr:uncharacterized protein PGUG_05740 [Meyerozyma guilliermondii ATCC 6260]EDK41642.2 hypothetical protein PGUG_05740 [Meyerozyma guilliermondii ATCC 6260]